MSTNILGNAKRINDAEEEDLSRYVRRILGQKRLSFRDVQRNSGGRITQGYVGQIVNGGYANPSVEKLKALACGLGESEEDVFRAARGLPTSAAPFRTETGDISQMLGFVDLMRKVASDTELMKLVRELVELPADARRTLLKAISSLREGQLPQKPRRRG
jgi:transcriptional regulator with XRE-family HTH domain